MSLNVALYTAISGLLLNQRSLDVTAQNVANVNTEGYSRKILNQEAVVLDGFGAGVKLASISRKVDEFLLNDIRQTLSQSNHTRSLDHFYGRTQDLFGAPGSDSSIGNMIGDLEASVLALANIPESLTAQTELVDRARLTAQRFRDIARDIQTLRLEADQNIEDAVNVINSQLRIVEEMNVQIAQNLGLGREASELQDQRDMALNKIAERMDIEYFTRDNGEVVVFTGGGRTLLDRTARTLSHSAVSALSAQTVWNAAGTGSIDGIMLDGADITAEIRSGEIAGLIEVRDSILPDLNSQFGELAYALQYEMNALHNQGAAFPGAPMLTGTQSLNAVDTPVWTGNFRVAAVDSAGVVVEVQDFDLSTFATVNDLVTAINGMANMTASLNANGQLELTASAGNNVVLNEMNSAVTVGASTMGAAHFLGLNSLFTSSSDNYDRYLSAQQTSSTTALNLTGTLTFSGAFGTANVAYGPGDDLATVAANITANGTLAGAGISATVVNDGSGYRLRIEDAGGDNFFMTDTGSLVSTLNVRVDAAMANTTIDVRSDIANDPSRIARGALSNAVGLAVGDVGLTSGDRSVIQAMANKLSERLSFDRVGGLGTSTRSIADYGAAIVGLNATEAVTTSDSLEAEEFLLDNLSAKAASISGVNLDEEMANTIILENAYAAASRVITTTQQLMDLLEEMVR